MTREEAIDCLNIIRTWAKGDSFYECIDMAIAALEQSKWIPCSERLPEENGNYIVTGTWESGKLVVGECYFSTEDGYFNAHWCFDVAAWQPLPEPYKTESEGEE